MTEYSLVHPNPSSCSSIPIPNDCLLPKPTIHSTFLDAYVPYFEALSSTTTRALESYGEHATWAEHYVEKGTPLEETNSVLRNASNFDVTGLDPTDYTTFGCPALTAINLVNPACRDEFAARHGWPYRWYNQTINNLDAPDYVSKLGFGFPMSPESGGQLPSLGETPGDYSPGGVCNLKTQPSSCRVPANAPPVPLVYRNLAYGASTNFLLQPSTNLLGSSTGNFTFPNSTTAQIATGSPVWLSVRVDTSTLNNVMRFNYEFLAGLRGFLSVFFDGRRVFEADQQYVLPATNTASEILLGEVLPGQHVISLRLDAFDTAQSVIEISDVQIGMMQLTTNVLPIARAGQTQTVRLGSLVTLNASASSDPDNAPGPLTYTWTKSSGPSGNLSGGNTSKPTFTPTVAGTYVFGLIVNDGLNNSAPASVRIIVPKLGDVDVDGDVDLVDVAKVTLMVSKKASGPNDLRDLNGDGKIDLNDLKMFPKLCSRPLCLPEKH